MPKLNYLRYQFAVLFRLGFLNILRKICYKLFGRYLVPRESFENLTLPGNDTFFRAAHDNEPIKHIEYFFRGFDHLDGVDLSKISWSENLITGDRCNQMKKNSFDISDFDNKNGDIKGIWEPSRFSWVMHIASSYLDSNNDAIDYLNKTISSWKISNPPYYGPNWKCGQEAALRVINLATAAMILNQVEETEQDLLAIIKKHLKRIKPTIFYALSQDNNHGTSEAAALFIGGSWLLKCGDMDGYIWEKTGRKWLENRANRLIEDDGSFSQYSVNYHRLMLDTFVLSELWRREIGQKPFNSEVYSKLKAASKWLYEMVQMPGGNVPNIGANDGAHLMQIGTKDFRDFSPSVQLASVVFLEAVAWKQEGIYDLPIKILCLTRPEKILEISESFHFNNGGYMGFRNKEGAFLLFNYPNYRFRPSQCDALHVDFWVNGVNLLRDGGTYSYNAGKEYLKYFSGTESHNTVQFDGLEQMPRLQRFLFGAWLKPKNVIFNAANAMGQAAYKDFRGCRHSRNVYLNKSMIRVTDEVSGMREYATLRWRLSPGNWILKDNMITNGNHTLTIRSNTKIEKFNLTTGWESTHYFLRTQIPVLEIEVSQDSKIITEYKYK